MHEKRKRALALRDEGVRHPFRQALPPEILASAKREAALTADAAPRKVIVNEDVSLFLLSFIAFFMAIYLFIF